MRHERCSDDESDSYPRIGYQHFIDPSRACLALASEICLAAPHSVVEGCPIGGPRRITRVIPPYLASGYLRFSWWASWPMAQMKPASSRATATQALLI